MDINEIKSRANEAIESQKARLIGMGQDLYQMPETGFRERRSSAYMEDFLSGLGLTVQNEIALTGLKATARGASDDFTVAVCGELDALLMPDHPNADPVTGAAHVCGHHSQLTMVAGVALGLVETGLIKELDGNLSFLVVPAEEIIELEYRADLVRQGKIKYFGGKQNFIHYGAMDDIDCVLCSHLTTVPEAYFDYGKHYNGVVTKEIRFHGKSAHSALSPHLAVNALHAAIAAINNINALRERFRDEDHVRVHYIITKGGHSVNIIPDEVCVEMGVRAANLQALSETNRLVNEAIAAGAAGVGARATIIDYGGYLPFTQNEAMSLLFAENAGALVGPERVEDTRSLMRASSTDAGDFSSMLPTIHPNFGGARGNVHSNDFEVADEYLAYVLPAKAYAMTVIDLLWNQAEKGKAIRNSFEPDFKNRQEYDKFSEKLIRGIFEDQE
ncbi:MAG: amidohydrolase [Saccharofermentanales bacterium]